MDAAQPEIHSFILKFWREEMTAADDRPAWRGHITHVPNGERESVQDLAAILAFIRRYLVEPSFPTGVIDRGTGRERP
jgi:hypothetical protein